MAEMKQEICKETNDSLKEDDWEIDIKEVIINNQRHRRPSSRPCCIYRAHVLRDVKSEAFIPKFVSIGPLHHFQKHLQDMEETKIHYLEQFLQHAHAAKTTRLQELGELEESEKMALLGWKGNENEKQGENNDFLLLSGELLGILQSRETDIRSCYAENLNQIPSKEFLRLVLVDTAFIIELFLRYHFCRVGYLEEDTMLPPFYKLLIMRGDLWLLENQLPLFILENLYALAFGSIPQIYPPFLQLTFNFFEYYNLQKMMPDADTVEGELNHFTDLLRAFFLRQPMTDSDVGRNRDKGQIWKIEEPEIPLDDHLPSATELHNAGVKFIATEGKCLVGIHFSESSGRLEIPSVNLWGENIADYFRNLIALEQNHYPTEPHISYYCLLMDYLIDTSKDADLLIKKKIIKHSLGSSDEVASLFNSLCINIAKGYINLRSYVIIRQLTKYHSQRRHRWKANLWRQYFDTPWKGASTIAAIILLALTLAQTIMSGLALKSGNGNI